MKNNILQQVKDAIRNPYAWPGGYPVYTLLSDGDLLCCTCAKDNFRLIADSTKHNNFDGWKAEGALVLWEGEEMCAHCGKVLESAYGPAESD